MKDTYEMYRGKCSVCEAWPTVELQIRVSQPLLLQFWQLFYQSVTSSPTLCKSNTESPECFFNQFDQTLYFLCSFFSTCMCALPDGCIDFVLFQPHWESWCWVMVHLSRIGFAQRWMDKQWAPLFLTHPTWGTSLGRYVSIGFLRTDLKHWGWPWCLSGFFGVLMCACALTLVDTHSYNTHIQTHTKWAGVGPLRKQWGHRF